MSSSSNTLPRNSSRTSLSRQASTVSNAGSSTNNNAAGTIAIGIDLGSFNARIGMYDETLQHPVVVSNRDGHRTTKIAFDMEMEDPLERKQAFFENIMELAADAAHTKDLHVVVSVPNRTRGTVDEEEWNKVFLLQEKAYKARVITEAAAVCLAYEESDEQDTVETTSSSFGTKKNRTLIIDGGAKAVTATILSQKTNTVASNTGTFWKLDRPEESLDTVNGNALLEPLAKFVAQQFELKHRFPRGEVWENSKKARTKIFAACQVGLKTLYINNSSVTIHVDGLYEGIDYQVQVSKPKWEHLSGKLVRETKAFLSKFKDDANVGTIDRVLLSGGLYTWLTPIVKGIFGDKVQTNTSYFDPSEAIAMGCTKQANYHLELSGGSNNIPVECTTTLDVPMAPVSIGIGEPQQQQNDGGGGESKDGDNTSIVLIEKGTPLPAMVTQTSLPSSGSIELWQWEPTSKALCKLEELTDTSVLKLQMTAKGQLRVWVDGETLEF